MARAGARPDDAWPAPARPLPCRGGPGDPRARGRPAAHAGQRRVGPSRALAPRRRAPGSVVLLGEPGTARSASAFARHRWRNTPRWTSSGWATPVDTASASAEEMASCTPASSSLRPPSKTTEPCSVCASIRNGAGSPGAVIDSAVWDTGPPSCSRVRPDPAQGVSHGGDAGDRAEGGVEEVDRVRCQVEHRPQLHPPGRGEHAARKGCAPETKRARAPRGRPACAFATKARPSAVKRLRSTTRLWTPAASTASAIAWPRAG